MHGDAAAVRLDQGFSDAAMRETERLHQHLLARANDAVVYRPLGGTGDIAGGRKRLLRALILASFVTPPFLGAFAWVLLGGPNAGLINQWYYALFGLKPFEAAPLINIFSAGGMVFVMALYTFPYVFLDPEIRRQLLELGGMVGEETVELDVEAEPLRRSLRPALHRRDRGDRIEARVQLDGIEAFSVEVQPVLGRQSLRIPVLDEAGVRPARGADDDRHALTIALAGYWWPMPRLRRSDCAIAGIKRRRRGRGFEYVDEGGERIEDPDVVERIRALAIPPGWEDVWICVDPLGHIQATGMDARGRKQYRYHDLWRERRDRQKFDAMLDFGRALPKLRDRVERDLRKRRISRERVLACAVRLLDRGFFRIGSEDYAEENETYGLATMRKRHVIVKGDTVTFDYEAKGGKRRVQVVGDRSIAGLVKTLRARRGGGHELLAYRNGSSWRDVKSTEINDYIQETLGEGHSAKDFRTWNATVLAAVVLAASARERDLETKGSRARAKRDAVKQVAHYLGNTPAVCRASYIDPRVFDRFDGGLTVGGVFERLPEDPADWPQVQGPIEKAVLDLIDRRESPAIERVD